MTRGRSERPLPLRCWMGRKPGGITASIDQCGWPANTRRLILKWSLLGGGVSFLEGAHGDDKEYY